MSLNINKSHCNCLKHIRSILSIAFLRHQQNDKNQKMHVTARLNTTQLSSNKVKSNDPCYYLFSSFYETTKIKDERTASRRMKIKDIDQNCRVGGRRKK